MDPASFRQNFAALSCSLAAMMTGSAFVWYAPLMLRLTSTDSPVPMGYWESSWLVSTIELGELASVLPAGLLADRFGRKTIILSSGPLCAIGFLLKATVKSMPVLYAVQVVQGITVAIAFVVCPIYIAEMAEPRIRGKLSSHFQTMFYAGLLFDYAVGPYVSFEAYAYICLSLPVLLVATFSLAPETPYHLLVKGRDAEARAALAWLRCTDNVDAEFKSIFDTVVKERQSKGSWRELFGSKKDRMAFFIVQIVCLTKYMNGMTVLMTYASQTLGQAVNNYLGHNELTILIGALLTVTTFLSSFMSDSIGRRPLLVFSSIGAGLCLFVLAAYYFIEFETTIDTSPFVWFSYVALTAYCITVNVGLAPLMQTIQAEFFSSNTRGIGSALTEAFAAGGAFVTVKQYQPIQDSVGVYFNYIIYAFICVIGAYAIYKFVPETTGKSLGEIQDTMEKNEKAKADAAA